MSFSKIQKPQRCISLESDKPFSRGISRSSMWPGNISRPPPWTYVRHGDEAYICTFSFFCWNNIEEALILSYRLELRNKRVYAYRFVSCDLRMLLANWISPCPSFQEIPFSAGRCSISEAATACLTSSELHPYSKQKGMSRLAQ